jgi:hypothetical protein
MQARKIKKNAPVSPFRHCLVLLATSLAMSAREILQAFYPLSGMQRFFASVSRCKKTFYTPHFRTMASGA